MGIRSLKETLNNERGAVLVFVTIAMAITLAAAGLVFDGGLLYSQKSKLQNALDSGALAGGQMLLTNPDQVKATVVEIANQNGASISEADVVVDETVGSVEVKTNHEQNMAFAQFVGVDEIQFSVSAKVQMGWLYPGKPLTPIGIAYDPTKTVHEQFTQYEEYTMTHGPGEGFQGNYGFLKFGASGGADRLKKYIKEGLFLQLDPNNPEVTTEPGQNMGPVRDGINYIVDSDTGKSHCSQANTAEPDCKRVIIVPLVGKYDVLNGRDETPILGFAAFWVSEKMPTSGPNKSKEIKGKFLKVVLPTSNQVSEGSVVKLIK